MGLQVLCSFPFPEAVGVGVAVGKVFAVEVVWHSSTLRLHVGTIYRV